MKPPPSSRFAAAVAAIDAALAEDPHRETAGGEPVPAELLYGRRMSAWLERLEPDAGVALRLAVRCQHLGRWKIPRDDYPRGRRGYLAWRNACKRLHSEAAGEILTAAGVDEPTVRRVRDLVEKRRLAADPEAQRLEDAACLVFLENGLAAFAAEHPEEKVVAVLRKTWGKMSPRGQAAALALPLPPPLRELVERALG
jgi:hypothetical protein